MSVLFLLVYACPEMDAHQALVEGIISIGGFATLIGGRDCQANHSGIIAKKEQQMKLQITEKGKNDCDERQEVVSIYPTDWNFYPTGQIPKGNIKDLLKSKEFHDYFSKFSDAAWKIAEQTNIRKIELHLSGDEKSIALKVFEALGLQCNDDNCYEESYYSLDTHIGPHFLKWKVLDGLRKIYGRVGMTMLYCEWGDREYGHLYEDWSRIDAIQMARIKDNSHFQSEMNLLILDEPTNRSPENIFVMLAIVCVVEAQNCFKKLNSWYKKLPKEINDCLPAMRLIRALEAVSNPYQEDAGYWVGWALDRNIKSMIEDAEVKAKSELSEIISPSIKEAIDNLKKSRALTKTKYGAEARVQLEKVMKILEPKK